MKKQLTTIAALALFAVCFSLATCSAAELVIKMKSGETRTIPLDEIETISFAGEGAGSIDFQYPADTPLDTLMKMKELVAAGDFEEVFQYIGEKDASGPMTDEHIEKYGDQAMKELSLHLDRELTYGKLIKEREKEGEWNVIPVSYTEDGNEKTVYFAFLKVDGKWLLCDLDS